MLLAVFLFAFFFKFYSQISRVFFILPAMTSKECLMFTSLSLASYLGWFWEKKRLRVNFRGFYLINNFDGDEKSCCLSVTINCDLGHFAKLVIFANVSDMTSLSLYLSLFRGVSLTLSRVLFIVFVWCFVLSLFSHARVYFLCVFWFCSIFKTKSAFKSLVSFYFTVLFVFIFYTFFSLFFVCLMLLFFIYL